MIDRLGQEQHGVVARRQLLAAGVSPRAVERRLRSGRLLAVHRGVYRVGGAPRTQLGDWMAAVLAAGSDAHLSHLSAAHLWGLVDQSGVPHVTRRSGGRSPAGYRLHHCRHLPADELARVKNIPVTGVARTLVDLAGMLGERRLGACLNEARRLRLVDVEDVRRAMARQPNKRGLGTLRRLVDRIDPAWLPTKSELEDLFRALCQEAGLPEPERNVRLHGHEVDCLWPDRKVIVELDGHRFHHHRTEEDYARDLYYLGLGYRTIRITYRMVVDQPDRVVEILREVLGVEKPGMGWPA